VRVTLHNLGGQTFDLRAVPPEPVFVAEQVRIGAACGTQHIGHATLRAMLYPVHAGDALACIDLPSGRQLHIRASAICSAANVATLRLRPATTTTDGRRS